MHANSFGGGVDLMTTSKKKNKRKNLSTVAESDGGIDTAEEEELAEHYSVPTA